MNIGDDQSELCTCVPALRCSFGVSVVEIYRDRVIWWCVGVAERKEEDTPARHKGLRKDLQAGLQHRRTTYAPHIRSPDL